MQDNDVLFETKRLVVRRAGAADVDHLLTILSDPDNVRLYGSGQPFSRTEVVQLIASYPIDDPQLICQPGLVLLKPMLTVIGFGGVGYYLGEGKRAELLFVLAKAYWGKGFATELADAALVEAFRCSEVLTVYATVKPANPASIRVLEKCGMRAECYLPNVDRIQYRRDRPVWSTSVIPKSSIWSRSS